MSSSLAGLSSIAQVGPSGVALGKSVGCQANVAENSSEKIIEIVGNTAGEQPQTFELGRLPELFIQALAFGNVPDDADENVLPILPVFGKRDLERDFAPILMFTR